MPGTCSISLPSDRRQKVKFLTSEKNTIQAGSSIELVPDGIQLSILEEQASIAKNSLQRGY